jgi:hypothetical protein
VADEGVAVFCLLHCEAETVVAAELGGVHLTNRLLEEDAAAAQRSAVDVDPKETRHVLGGEVGDTGNNPRSIDADYGRVDLGLKFGKMDFGAGYEVLGGAEGEGSFSTPLATLHKFNGWADKFLDTPANGLRDAFISAGATLERWKLNAVYHDFSADSGGASWGTELDGSVVYTAPRKQQFAFEFGLYDADDWSVDTDKLWLWTRWGF